jgi:hypothetical protein
MKRINANNPKFFQNFSSSVFNVHQIIFQMLQHHHHQNHSLFVSLNPSSPFGQQFAEIELMTHPNQ